jgi:transcriptional regulator with XRE-family HTH domain
VAPSLDERRSIGRRLKRLRDEQGFTQKHIVEKTEMSTGTVQAIEYGKPTVHIENLEKYATAVNTTIQAILHPEIVPPPSELLKDLNHEHLGIARLYMKAYKTNRAAVEILLSDERHTVEIAADLAELVVTLKHTTPHDAIVAATELLLTRSDLLMRVADRLESDPAFEGVLRKLVESKNAT